MEQATTPSTPMSTTLQGPLRVGGHSHGQQSQDSDPTRERAASKIGAGPCLKIAMSLTPMIVITRHQCRVEPVSRIRDHKSLRAICE
jgi:hypothetical protein